MVDTTFERGKTLREVSRKFTEEWLLSNVPTDDEVTRLAPRRKSLGERIAKVQRDYWLAGVNTRMKIRNTLLESFIPESWAVTMGKFEIKLSRNDFVDEIDFVDEMLEYLYVNVTGLNAFNVPSGDYISETDITVPSPSGISFLNIVNNLLK